MQHWRPSAKRKLQRSNGEDCGRRAIFCEYSFGVMYCQVTDATGDQEAGVAGLGVE
jgi:hypothetical protein